MQRDGRPGNSQGGNQGQSAGQSSLGAIEKTIEPTVVAMGYVLVRVMLSGGNSNPVLQIMVERQDERSMTVDHCAEISRAISAVLDLQDPIADAYRLEVSSPGIDRPLVKPQDFERFVGEVAKVETTEPVDGRKRFQGKLLGVRNAEVRLQLDEGAEVTVPLSAVRRAKLVLTDELLRAHYARQQQEQVDQMTLRKTGA